MIQLDRRHYQTFCLMCSKGCFFYTKRQKIARRINVQDLYKFYFVQVIFKTFFLYIIQSKSSERKSSAFLRSQQKYLFKWTTARKYNFFLALRLLGLLTNMVNWKHFFSYLSFQIASIQATLMLCLQDVLFNWVKRFGLTRGNTKIK